ncbi:hypothetical protein PV963_43000 [Streptomyces coeruleorubidus]|uniref:hypothetical protein n=1 Tax=Streptomyces coeruleorubidus TaxID=116188 RepID=UPI00237F8765|nr:hypothetical protein [Streptomyces coeruleorubidus]WDV56614.1 hypothetical protein PV963_43000 [Streptomyces coeruleorubidus]
MNVIELLADLQAQHDETAALAGELRDQIEHLTAALAETEARLADLATTRKVIAQRVPPGTEPDPPTAYQTIVNAFNQHPDQAFRARDAVCQCPVAGTEARRLPLIEAARCALRRSGTRLDSATGGS